MYEAAGLWLEGITAVVCGYCMQSFFGSFSKSSSRRWRGLAAVLLYAGWECIGRRTFPVREGFEAAFYFSADTLILFLLARFWYRQAAQMAAFLAVSFLAVCRVSAYLVHVVAMAGEGLNYLLLRFSENGKLTAEETAELAEGAATMIQIAIYASFWVLLYISLRRLAADFPEGVVCLHKKEAMLLMLPGGMGLLFCLLLRLLMLQEPGVLLYDRLPAARWIVPAVLALVLYLILFAVRLYQDILCIQKERNARMTLELQLDGMRVRMGEMEHVYSGVRGLRHDMRNTLAVVTELLKKRGEENCGGTNGRESAASALQVYLEEWNRSLAGLEFRFCTGNVVIDALLEMKQRELARAVPGLAIWADGLLFPDGLLICGYDLGVILGNALDNAAEACIRLKEKEPDADLFLKLYSVCKGRFVLLEIANSFDGEIVRSENREFPASRKEQNSPCGIGLMNIKAAAEKYHGTVDWTVQGRTFVLTVLLQNERSEENDKQ